MKVPIVSDLNLPSAAEFLENYNENNPDGTIFMVFNYKIGTPNSIIYPVMLLDIEHAPNYFDLTEEVNKIYSPSLSS
jgi:hypothetical protein